MSGLLTLYEALTRAGKPVLEHILRARLKAGKEAPSRLAERKGCAARPRPSGPLVWVHAASVGEAQSALILINAIGARFPSVNILITTGTLTSATLMARRLPPFAFHQFVPVDHPAWVEKFLNHWSPDLALWMESELWPNILTSLKRRQTPLVLVNARLSDKSFSRWKFVKGFAREILECFTLILAQTEKDVEHYRHLGAKTVMVTDNIKYSAAPLPYDAAALSALKLAIGERPVWVYASTHKGEESLACRAHKKLKQRIPDLLTIIVPRHPERRNDIAKTCFETEIKYRLRSQNNALPVSDDDVYIADTLGELGLFYTACPIAMIGRSFSDDGGGGHNPVEAAQLGCAVITGPNNQYQRQIYDDMRAYDSVIEAENEDDFIRKMEELLTDPERLKIQKERAATFVEQKTHVIDIAMEQLLPVLQETVQKNAA